MSDKVIRWTTVDGECVTHHAMRVDDGGEQCIRCHALADVLHAGFLCGNCRDAEQQSAASTGSYRPAVVLADAELEALEWAASMVDDINRGDPVRAAAIRGLLERLGGGDE